MNDKLQIQTAIPENTDATRDDRWEVQCLGSDGEWHIISDSSQMTEEEATTMAREMSIDAEEKIKAEEEIVTVYLDQDSGEESAWIVDTDVRRFGESVTQKLFPPTAAGRAAALSFARKLADQLCVEMIDLGNR